MVRPTPSTDAWRSTLSHGIWGLPPEDHEGPEPLVIGRERRWAAVQATARRVWRELVRRVRSLRIR
jgi:hypothetical protein